MKKFNILYEEIKSNFKFKVGQNVFVVINDDLIKNGIIIKRMHKGEFKTQYFKIQFDKNSQMIYPQYRLGKTKQQALKNSKQFDNSLFN